MAPCGACLKSWMLAYSSVCHQWLGTSALCNNARPFAFLWLNSEAFINLVMAPYCSGAWLGYRGAGVDLRTSVLVLPLREVIWGHVLHRVPTDWQLGGPIRSLAAPGWGDEAVSGLRASECLRYWAGGLGNMLDPPALRSHMSHIWFPLIRHFTYTQRGVFVHITPWSTMWFTGVTECKHTCTCIVSSRRLLMDDRRYKRKLNGRRACMTHIANWH